ncbi:nucleoside recognition domain-containing protein [soil metagenome]
MLNYIWAGLIISSLVFAIVADSRDLATDRYRNEQPLPVIVEFPDGYDPDTRSQPVQILIDPAAFQAHYGTEATPDSIYAGVMRQTSDGAQLRFAPGASFPEPLSTIATVSQTRDNELQGVLRTRPLAPGATAAGALVSFEVVRFVKLNAIAQAAFDFATTAAELALGLIGILALFLGLLRIADKAGIVAALVRFTQPIFRPLFPEIPDGHPAMGVIVLNLTANIMGLGNAATPLGIKAMEELQKLNPHKETATNSMVMLLALNTASVQLVPPALLVAVMGLQVNQLILPIIVVTFASAVVAVTTAKLLQRMKVFRNTDPMTQPVVADGPATDDSMDTGTTNEDA